MRVLLTGASGYLGRHVLARLAAQGIEVVAIGRRAPHAGVPFIAADLLDPAQLAEAVASAGATHLLHLAWYAEHGKYWTSPLNLRWVDASVRLTEAFCQAGGTRVVVAGTCAEYDWADGYCREDHTALVPATLYGVAKDAARRLVASVCAQHAVPCAWGRVFLPFAQDEDPRRLLPSLLAVFKGEKPPFGVNASAYRDFLHADDVADAFIALLRSRMDGSCNISSGQPVRIAEVVTRLALASGRDARIVLDLSSERPGEPPLLVGAPGKLHALPWRPARSLDDFLDSAGNG